MMFNIFLAANVIAFEITFQCYMAANAIVFDNMLCKPAPGNDIGSVFERTVTVNNYCQGYTPLMMFIPEIMPDINA